MENKNLKIVIIILMVVLVCVTGLCVFFVIDVSNKVHHDSNGNVLNKTKVKADLKVDDSTKNNEESDFVETIINNDVQNYESNDEHDEKLVGTISLDNKTVQKLYSYVDGFVGYKVCSFKENKCVKYEDEIKDLTFRITGYVFKNNMNLNNIPDDIKIGVVVRYLKKINKVPLTPSKEIGKISNTYDCFVFDIDLIKEYSKIIFGNNTEINFDSVVQADAMNDGMYDNNKKYLAHSQHAIGFTIGASYIGSKLIDVVNNDDSIVLYQKTFYKRTSSDSSTAINVYDNYNEDKLVKSFSLDEYSKITSKLGEEKALWSDEEISNNASIYKYIFKYDEENKHYYFYSVEKYK